ncbi:ankyrin repeat domain-containing protein [Marinobacter salinexigens]|uniref:Ankyrin repeat domain-containing protein n=1 Tax=Marinobacter salinexigens TaxID=2919747 RepID=A0A5B0VAP2_9GAMM|nr:ankyrin repeat domain-containing protein [Marinobacter salinexigens]KAA1171438.1 ankyrin repeat domain-containing protein [Marinobacter salinexigens]
MAKGTGVYPLVLTAFVLALPGLSGCSSSPESTNLSRQNGTASATPLFEAASSGDLEQVTVLAEAGVSLNTLTEQGSPLMAAVVSGQDRVVLYLLAGGANPELSAGNGETPLMVAAGAGSRRLVQLLLSAGADVNAEDVNGSTPVIRAAERGNLSVVKLLLTAGANVNVSQGGESLLMKIVANGDLLTSEMLLSAGADVNFRGHGGSTALDIARSRHYRDLEMLLVQAGAEL